MDFLTKIVTLINDYFWGYFLVFLLCGTGVFFTIYLKGVQIKYFKLGFNTLFKDFSLTGKKAGKDGMSSFQAVATAIAAQVGTGNLVGAVSAIIAGGPGAIFWMWVAAFFGMATIFAEAVLAQKFKTKDDSGQIVGGPAYYISKGLNNKTLACVFSVCIIVALGFMGNMVQSNSIADAFKNSFNVPTYVVGVVLATITALIIIKGISAIASVAEKLVPIMAVLYIFVGVIIILVNITKIPGVFSQIIVGAFNPSAVWGGVIGVTISKAMRYGIARGLFSNEAGMGSTPHAHAVAKASHPAVQGTLGVVSVFIDTFVILNITAFLVLSSNVIKFDANGEPLVKGIVVVQEAFKTSLLGSLGSPFITICLMFFAFTTIISWYYFAESNVRFLFGSRGLMPFKLLVVVFVFVGSIVKLELVWQLADLFNGLMVIPNLIALILLKDVVKNILTDFEKNKK